MPDTSVTKVSSQYSPKGPMGQKYLASGIHMAMRYWDEESGEEKPETTRSYETVGYVIDGRAELDISGQKVVLEPGDSWAVPKETPHRYRILEHFVAVEATYPPAVMHGRDES